MHIDLSEKEPFVRRHIGPLSFGEQQVNEMLQTVNAGSLDELIGETIPSTIRLDEEPRLPRAITEDEFLRLFRKIGAKNKVYRSFIGMGYYPTRVPTVIQRNILENPGWYTSYTPYQAEISQGRLEMLVNFQTMITDLTGMELANASLLDEGTAAAEAMSMFHSMRKGSKKSADVFFVADDCHPQTIEVIRSRTEPLDIRLRVDSLENLDPGDESIYGVLLAYPNTRGSVTDYTDLVQILHAHNIFAGVVADLMSLVVLKSPGEMDVDVVVGSSQRFGVPMGFGGPHAAFFATRDEYKRLVPGRIIGVSKDADGNVAYRMALQTREQHIRREKATSNICTAQVLLAVMAGAYGVYHGPDELRNIAWSIHAKARLIEQGLGELGFHNENPVYFDTLYVNATDDETREKVRTAALKRQINLRYYPDHHVGISLDEAATTGDIRDIMDIFSEASGQTFAFDVHKASREVAAGVPGSLKRTSDFMTHPNFHQYHSEHEMLRYLKRLENKDLSLVHSMISLGSCTMKLNATTEMIPLSWPEFSQLHPFVPTNQALGYKEMFDNLTEWLKAITGFDAVSLQPNSGAQGEFTGLLTIRAWHQSRGDLKRKVALIPSSAHGTNPASAVMAGLKVVVVKCDDKGNIDVEDLRAKAEQNAAELAALMVTYPSTHGVFEEAISEICEIIHQNGGLVYMDGANMNAQVGLTSPARIGADVCHLNLHKTFCIPHGGGGPGMGPIACTKELAPYLPGHPFTHDGKQHLSPVASAPSGSASILTISYAYIALMGVKGLTLATQYAILNANYIKSRLEGHYQVLYVGEHGRVGHEMIIDLRPFKQSAGIEVLDIAKRLMDYGFHSPTVSFPVPGTMMIEPTESETKQELDRFCDALIAIREEIKEIEEGVADRDNNVLRNAPHTMAVIASDHWPFPYSRQKAAYPVPWLLERKFWSSVRRVDDAYGDRNLMCSCPPISEYNDQSEKTEPVS